VAHAVSEPAGRASGRGPGSDVRDAAADIANNDWGERAARTGIAARGLAFLVLAYLVVRIALGALGDGGTNKTASGPGVAQAVAAQTGGRVMLLILGIGLLLYALFLALDAVRHHDDQTDQWKRWLERVEPLFGCVLYILFGVYCIVRVFTNSSSGQSARQSNRQQTQWSAEVLRWPAGWLWLGGLGVVLFVIAAVQLKRGVKRDFEDDLEVGRMGRRIRPIGTGLGLAGHVGRALMFGIVGWFVLGAAVENDPKKGKGVDGAARMLANSAFGPTLLAVLAAGLAAFGLYQFVEAKYRKV
jgi:Domain of Unknown Function (DUF1206)